MDTLTTVLIIIIISVTAIVVPLSAWAKYQVNKTIFEIAHKLQVDSDSESAPRDE